MTHYRLIQDLSVIVLERTSSCSKLQIRPLVREGAAKYQTRNCLKKISRRKKNWTRVTDGCLTPRRTGRLIVGRNVTLTWLRLYY
jgi:hypothetical protein